MKSNKIHKFKQGENYFVLDISSGGVHIVDALAYKMLDALDENMPKNMPENFIEANSLEEYSKEEVSECYGEIYYLKENNMLFTEDDYRKYADITMDAPVKALCLHTAHDCNLRCEYCFAQTGDFGSGRKLMPVETGKKAIDFLIEKSHDRSNLEVDFFGGEPLMAWETVTQTVQYARSIEKKYGKNFRFTITTNGILLDDEKIEFINKEMSNCVLSLDGRKEINDRVRFTPNKKGSYDIILPAFKKLVSNRTNPGRTDYYVRGTFTKYNLDFTNDVLHIYNEGFRQISIEPVVTDEKYPFAITESDLPEIFREYDRLYEIMSKEDCGFNFFHFMVDLKQGPCAIKRLRGCGCGNEYAAVTPDGDIYPCHQYAGMEEWKMGNIFDGKLNAEIKKYFAGTHVYSKEGCSECWARFYCSGGCNASSLIYEGDARKPHKIACELQKKRTECAIALAALKISC